MTEFAVLSVIRKLRVSAAPGEMDRKKKNRMRRSSQSHCLLVPYSSKVKGSDTSGHFYLYSSGKWDSVTEVTGRV